MSDSDQSVTVKSGSWFHDDAVPHEVLINAEGGVFHVQFCKDGAVESTSAAFSALADAVAFAEASVTSPIHWDGAAVEPSRLL